MKERKVWIDWMKAIGMLTIVWGHCFPEGMSDFIYAFNVPVFFLVSGYLSHPEPSMKTCASKTLHTLIIPYLILAFIKAAGDMLKHLDDGQWLWSVVAILGGVHHFEDAAGCSNLWFVYTLILIKFIYQALPDKRLLLSVVALAGAVLFNRYELDMSWAVADVLLALPFFMIGNALRSSQPFETVVSRLTKGAYPKSLLLLSVLGLFLATYGVAWLNGGASMYKCLYGNSCLLFLLGAFMGSAAILLLSLVLNGRDYSIVRISAAGSLVTLVFHRELLHPLLKWIDGQAFDIVTMNLLMFLSSVLVMLAFVPIILIVKRFLPIVLGRRAHQI